MNRRKSSSGKRVPRYVEEELNDFSNAPGGLLKGFVRFKKISLTQKQSDLVDIIRNNKISVATGPAGTSKTFSTCFAGLKLFQEGLCDGIVITKPTEIIGGKDLGFLPGSLKDKLMVYEESFMSNFAEIIDKKDLGSMVESKAIEFKPVQFMRGSTFKNKVVIIDEFQSFDIKELMAIVTRLGENCKMVFIGDINQNDIDKKYVAVDLFKRILDGIKGVGLFEFERKDIVRDPILIEITDRYDQLKEGGKLTYTKNKA
jgi:phosphate starvation-inducible PhoH-like protein